MAKVTVVWRKKSRRERSLIALPHTHISGWSLRQRPEASLRLIVLAQGGERQCTLSGTRSFSIALAMAAVRLSASAKGVPSAPSTA